VLSGRGTAITYKEKDFSLIGKGPERRGKATREEKKI